MDKLKTEQFSKKPNEVCIPNCYANPVHNLIQFFKVSVGNAHESPRRFVRGWRMRSPEGDLTPQKNNYSPKKETRKSSNHPFSGAKMLVSGSQVVISLCHNFHKFSRYFTKFMHIGCRPTHRFTRLWLRWHA